jgi:hypothetical protein
MCRCRCCHCELARAGRRWLRGLHLLVAAHLPDGGACPRPRRLTPQCYAGMRGWPCGLRSYIAAGGPTFCTERSAVSALHRRLLRGEDEAAADLLGVVATLDASVQEHGSEQQHAAHRELFQYRYYLIDTPSHANITCQFLQGFCDPAAGPFAGVECTSKCVMEN